MDRLLDCSNDCSDANTDRCVNCDYGVGFEEGCKAQDLKTAEIKDAECRKLRKRDIKNVMKGTKEGMEIVCAEKIAKTREATAREVKGLLLMVRNELVFGGDWKTARNKIDEFLAKYIPSKED